MSAAKSILVVEDDDDIRGALVAILEEEGYRAIEARDGVEGLEVLARGAGPSLILLDLMMPRMNGFEFRAVQLGRPEWAAIPLVLLTAGADLSAEAAALRAAVAMRKPMRIQDLLDAIEGLLRQ